MDTLTYVTIRHDIACGRLRCLQNCCDAVQLRSVYRTMRAIKESDLVTLQRMLCCVIHPQGEGPSPTPPGGQSQGGTPSQPTDLRNCWQQLRDYACQAEVVLIALPAALTALTSAFPELAEFTVPLAIAIGSMSDDCHASSPADESVVGKFVQLACYVNGQLRKLRDKLLVATPESAKPLLKLVDQYVVGLIALDVCCPAGSQPTVPQFPPIPWALPEGTTDTTTALPD